MLAYGTAISVPARRLVKHADVIATMSLEGPAGSVATFHEGLQKLRPHAGSIESAANTCRIMGESEIFESHVDCGRVQDPYSIRYVPQEHGAVRDALQSCRRRL